MLKENYQKITTEKAKELSLKVLCDVAKFCDDHNLTYFLACGTLLGAVRHKGFIPWDDDIDIMMPRPDYDKLISIFNLKNYTLLDPKLGYFAYAKIYMNNTIKIEESFDYKNNTPFGIDIDIFPLDGSINDKELVLKQYKKQYFLEILLSLANREIFEKKSLRTAFNRLVAHLIGRKNIYKMVLKNATKYKYEDSDYVVRMKASTNGFTNALKKEVYEKAYLEFEGKMFCVPKGYDEWLTAFFGDYMVPPPIEERLDHNYEAYIKDEN